MLEDLDELTFIQTVKTFPAFMQSEISLYPTIIFAILKRRSLGKIKAYGRSEYSSSFSKTEHYEYVRNNIFVYSHKTQLCTIKYVYYTYYNDMFRPSMAIIRLYMKISSIYTIDHRSSVWKGWVGGYFARSRLGLGCAYQLACCRV